MASPVKLYQREMHENLGFFPTWFPGDLIEVGDLGVFSEGKFRKMSSLKEVGIPFNVSQGVSKQNVQYSSTKGTSITPSAGAAVPGVAKAEISVNFSQAGAFVFHATGLSPRQIENRSQLAEAIVMAYKREKWNKDWLLVEALHTADVATIIVSEDNKAGVVLAANVNAPLIAISLADPKVSLSVTSVSGKVIHVVGANDIHPLYSCLRLKEHFFSDPSLVPVRGFAPASVNAYDRPGIDELLDS
jgi:hypothetical protein